MKAKLTAFSNAQRSATGDTSSTPYKVLHKDKYGKAWQNFAPDKHSKKTHQETLDLNEVSDETLTDKVKDICLSDQDVKSLDGDLERHNLKSSANYPNKQLLSATHTIGRVVLDNEMDMDSLVKLLCGTGALFANYVAADLNECLQSQLNNEHFFKIKHSVASADNKITKA